MAVKDRASKKVLREVEIVHNPLIGAYLLWIAGVEYRDARGSAMPVLLSFLILPLLLHQQTLDCITSTQKSSGLALFAAKLGEQKEDLLAIHGRALVLRDLSLASLAAGIKSQMLAINYEAALIHAADVSKTPMIPERIKQLVRGAERLGVWFSSLTVNQIASLLRVDY